MKLHVCLGIFSKDLWFLKVFTVFEPSKTQVIL